MTDPVLRWRCERVAGDALDLGCAGGETAILLGREGHRVIGIDPQRAPVDAACEHLAAEEPSIRERVGFQLADPAELPFEDRSFDTVLLGDLLAKQVSRERPLAEARRVLRPGGRLIVTVPYAGAPGDDETAISLQALLGELAEFSVKEIATVGETLCLLADRAREKSRAALWRRALGVAERRIADRDEAFEGLSASVSDLQARREHEERALADARGDVGRLETALAAATHQRDRKEEEARLAADGVTQLEQRVEQLRQSRDRERAEAERELERHAAEAERKLTEAEQSLADVERERAEVESQHRATRDALESEKAAVEQGAQRSQETVDGLERDLAEARQVLDAKEGELEQARQATRTVEQELTTIRNSLKAREEHLRNAQLGIESRDAKLKAADESLAAQRNELTALEIRLETSDRELDEARRALEVQGGRLESAQEAARRAEQELTGARARLEARTEELERSQAAAHEAQRELTAVQESLRERERANAVLERDLAARVRELGLAGEQLVARERDLDLANEQLAAREAELDAAGTLLEAQGSELARAREGLRSAARERDEARAQLEQQRDEARAQLEQQRDEARTRLEAKERHLQNAKAGIESRDRKLATAERAADSRQAQLASRDAELQRLRAMAQDRERKLALTEARLEKAQQRAEYFKGSLVSIRTGRSYRLMRVLWRLRRPFKRSPRDAPKQAGEDDADSPGAAPHSPPVPPAAEPKPVPPAAPAPKLATPTPAPRRRPGDRLRVAAILDEMSEACFAPECDLVPLTLEGWRQQLDEHRPDLLLVESAWNGNGGEWQYRIAQYPRKDLVGLPSLRALLDGCRERGIPTAFWNKEDPVHFERFSEAAALFDHVFTTDARCVERYEALPGERTVTPLPFAAQPRIHNPAVVVPERSASPCFAGAWYRDRHPDRRRALESLLDAARPYGLVIYDRSFGGDDAAFGFPERFAPHILGKLPYERILDVYKSHRLFLNANSVVDSPTMCSRRVFELAACDTAILSTPGVALAALLGEGMVEEAGDEPTAASALERLLGDEPERTRRTRAARRAVFAEHTYADRLATIAETVGLDASSLRREPFAAPGAGANGSGPSANGAGDSHPWQLHLQPGVTLSEPALADLAAATTFADADVIGAHPARNGDAAIEHRHVPDLDPRALLLSRNLIESRGRPTGSPEQLHAQLREWSANGVRLYAADADLLAADARRPIGIGER